jgi:hypothetical protein
MSVYLFLKFCGPTSCTLTAVRTHQRVCHAWFHNYTSIAIGMMAHLLAHSCRNVANERRQRRDFSSLACRIADLIQRDILCAMWSVSNTAAWEILKQITQVARPSLYKDSKRSEHIKTEHSQMGITSASYAGGPTFKSIFVLGPAIPSFPVVLRFSRHVPEQCLRLGRPLSFTFISEHRLELLITHSSYSSLFLWSYWNHR